MYGKQQQCISHSSEIRVSVWTGLVKVFFLAYRWLLFSLCAHKKESKRERRTHAVTSLLTRALIPSLGPYPHDLI